MADEIKTNTTSESKRKKKTADSEVVATINNKNENITDDMEIEVESLISHVSYYDNKTGDRYEWDEASHIELMTFESLKNMYRNNRSYFTNLWIKPNNQVVIKHFRLERLYNKYDEILDVNNYTNGNIDHICEIIKTLPNSLKFATFYRIQNWVSNGDIASVKVVRRLEQKFGLDLIDLID